jgi:hypothetical protein
MNTTTAAGPVSIEGYQRTRKLAKRAQSTLLVAFPLAGGARIQRGISPFQANFLWTPSPRCGIPEPRCFLRVGQKSSQQTKKISLTMRSRSEVIEGALARDETLVSRRRTGCMLPLQLCAITLTSQKPARLSRLTKTRATAFMTMRCR